MIKLIAFIPKRSDITIERFHIHWRAPHGEMAKGIVLFNRYVQGHRVASLDPGLGPTEYEGTAEIWFDDLQAALRQGQDPVYAEHVGPDEANFIDLNRLAYLYTREEIVVDDGPVGRDDGGVKLVQGVRRAPEIGPEEFGARWSEEEPGLASRLGAVRHVRSVALPYHYENDTNVFDGVREMRWTDIAAYERARSDEAAWAELITPGVLDPAATSSMLVEEFRLIWP